jgi:uncharacterized protein (TIGR03118 family)
MKPWITSFGRLFGCLLTMLAVLGAGALASTGHDAQAAAAKAAAKTASGTVLQTNLVSDLPGVAAVLDPNLVNPWGISESSGSPFWISDNNAGVATLYGVPGANPPVSIDSLVVGIPIPVNPLGSDGTPTGTVFNTALQDGAFPIAGVNKSAPAIFLFATEDGTIVGWNPGVNPPGTPAGEQGKIAIVAVDKSGNNFTNPDPKQQTGAVYKGLAIATAATPIFASDAASTALLYATNFRSGTVDVFDATFHEVTASDLPAGAFSDPELPEGYAPFDVQVLGGKVYITYALQDATRHDDVAGPHHGFVDVYNLDGTPGLAGGATRLISRGRLDSPWGLAIAPQGFAGLSAPNADPVLLVGNFGNGRINAFDATTGETVGRLTDPDGEPIKIDGLWALKVGNGNGNGNGGASNTVYFTAGPFGESHGLFGSLSTVAPGSPEGPAEEQWVKANADVVQLDQAQLNQDKASGAPPAVIKQDTRKLEEDSRGLARAQRAFADDTADDAG